MAEEGNSVVPKVGDSNDDTSKSAEIAMRPAEPSSADQGTEEPLKGGDEEAGQKDADAAADDKPEQTETPPPAETTEQTKPTESESQEQPGTPGDKDEGSETGPAGEEQEAAANGASASTKKSSKRKSSGVPEHRGKKLNKKKSVARITHLDAQPGEYYFARMKGYSPWPSIICDEEMLPQILLATRPNSTKQSDGTYTEHYQDGGKKVTERTFPVMFLQTNEFAWVPNTDLAPLDPEQCKNISEKSKAKNLIAAYKIASEGHDLQYFKDKLADHERALKEDEEAREEKAKAKQGKKKRKSMDVADEPEDEEIADEPTEKRKTTKKRKKDVDSEGESDKPIKTPKTATKLKLTTPKAPATDDSGKKGAASAKATKTKGAGGRKGKQAAAAAAASDEEEAAETPKKEEPKVDPAEAKAKKEKEVFYLRHRLQKGFLSRDQTPKEEEMEMMSNYITKLDSYDDLEISIIRETKINKVLKGIIKLADIPKESEYNFRGRSIDLLKKWKHWDAPSAEGGADKAATDKKLKPATNGVHKDANGKEGDNTKEADAAAPADADEPMPDADAAEPEKKAEKESTPAAVEEDKDAEAEIKPEAEPVAT